MTSKYTYVVRGIRVGSFKHASFTNICFKVRKVVGGTFHKQLASDFGKRFICCLEIIVMLIK